MNVANAIAVAVTAIIVPVVMRTLYQSAAQASLDQSKNEIAYARPMRAFVIIGWIFAVILAGVFVLIGDQPSIWDALLGFSLLGIMLLPLHVEVFGVRIRWDDESLYTFSPWRSNRVIPISSIRSCDYSTSMQWYRIFTERHGIVRVHSLATGIPRLLAVLPCRHPAFPPTPNSVS